MAEPPEKVYPIFWAPLTTLAVTAISGPAGRMSGRAQCGNYFFLLRFSRTRMLTSMGVPSKPNVSRRRRVMKRR